MRMLRKYLLHLLFTATVLTGIIAVRADADIRIAEHEGQDITFIDDDIVITASDGSQAHITPTGDLVIEGKPVPVDGKQRTLLLHYADGIHKLVREGKAIGKQSVRMLSGFLGLLVQDLVSGDADKKLDKDMQAKAAPVQDAALALCDTVRSEKQLQDNIVAMLPAFKPYAIISTDTEDDCHTRTHEV